MRDVGVYSTMPQVLTINAGSSSIRFALFAGGAQLARVMDEKLERVGNQSADESVAGLVNKLRAQGAAPDAIGHRVVHGMLHTQPERVTPALLEELKRISPYDPEHTPREIALI